MVSVARRERLRHRDIRHAEQRIGAHDDDLSVAVRDADGSARHRPSLRGTPAGCARRLSHSISVSQEDGGNRVLELCVWFDELEIRDPAGGVIPIAAFIAGGKRWWDAFNAGDDRTKGLGLIPLKGPSGL